MGVKATSARTYILTQAPKREPVPTPFWPDLDGQVYLQDIPSAELIALQAETLGENGQPDAAKAGAGLICKALVIREEDGTYSPVFKYPDDLGSVSYLGMSLLMPLFTQANAFFGLTSDALQSAKNGLGPMPTSSNGIGSVKDAILVP
jgi:hypothetical protein